MYPVCLCVDVCMSASAQGGQQCQISLEPGFQAVVNGIELGSSSVRAVSVF